jgi:hypothetical protein
VKEKAPAVAKAVDKIENRVKKAASTAQRRAAGEERPKFDSAKKGTKQEPTKANAANKKTIAKTKRKKSS